MALQPFLHDLVTVLRAPTTVLSGRDGQIRQSGAQGVFAADVRVLSEAVLTLDDEEPEALSTDLDGPSGARFVAVQRGLVDRGADPALLVVRHRRATADGMTESVELQNDGDHGTVLVVRLLLAADLASMGAVKDGSQPEPVPPTVEDGTLVWRSGNLVVRVLAAGAEVTAGEVSWRVDLPAGGRRTLQWSLVVVDPDAVVLAAPVAPPWERPRVAASTPALSLLVSRSLDDLDALRLVTPGLPHAQFFGAGSPWYLTLFGRDSLLAARLTLALGTDLAEGTLLTLAARQGVRDDPDRAEAPGKILHEVRRGALDLEATRQQSGLHLPPVYYGSIDATALWVILLHDAWRFGLAPETVRRLLPTLERALGWITGGADADGDGFAEYVDTTGHGLANQGWKDSADSVRFRSGRVAEPPIALAEVQGYAYQAAVDGAALLEAFGGDPIPNTAGPITPAGLRAWASGLAQRFRASFWVEDEVGPYPAMALDGAKRPVDARVSNMGHLLGTGLLDTDEAALVASRLAGPDLDSGLGVRTMSSADGGYAPLSYHCGSVWPHDTAVVAAGLAREGFGRQAARLVGGLLRAAPSFDYRLPELYAGLPPDRGAAPVPYPASCRPQAWAAAAGVSVLATLLGLEPDVPGGTVRLRPSVLDGSGTDRGWSVSGLRVGPARLDVAVAADGTATAEIDRADLAVQIAEP